MDVLLADAVALLNRALHARAVAAGDPRAESAISLQRATAARIGFGSGEETADGRFAAAREVDLHGHDSSPRRRREEQLRPEQRLGALLAGRERLDACETMLLRARVDLDAGREREAALQLRAGIEALRAELPGALGDEGHERDLAELGERWDGTAAAADAAARGELSDQQRGLVASSLEIAERVLRRRRVLQS